MAQGQPSSPWKPRGGPSTDDVASSGHGRGGHLKESQRPFAQNPPALGARGWKTRGQPCKDSNAGCPSARCPHTCVPQDWGSSPCSPSQTAPGPGEGHRGLPRTADLLDLPLPGFSELSTNRLCATGTPEARWGPRGAQCGSQVCTPLVTAQQELLHPCQL